MTTDNTPLNAGDELRENLWHYMGLCPGTEHSPCIFEVYISPEQQFEGVMEFIIADRKKHELQARIDELETHGSQWEAWKDDDGEMVSVDDVISWYKNRVVELKQGLERIESNE